VDYNPIEEAFAKIKNLLLLGKAAARSKQTLLDAIGAALSAISAQDVQGFFEPAGYRLTGHLLSNVLSHSSLSPSSSSRL
jgi:hypothetical protein